MEPFFLLSRNIVHACGFTRVQSYRRHGYTDHDVVIVWFVFSLNVIVVIS